MKIMDINNVCKFCNKQLSKDEIAVCKKLLGRNITEFMCIDCLADHIGCTAEDILIKIEEFKEQGCTLFL